MALISCLALKQRNDTNDYTRPQRMRTDENGYELLSLEGGSSWSVIRSRAPARRVARGLAVTYWADHHDALHDAKALRRARGGGRLLEPSQPGAARGRRGAEGAARASRGRLRARERGAGRRFRRLLLLAREPPEKALPLRVGKARRAAALRGARSEPAAAGAAAAAAASERLKSTQRAARRD